jgi:hypothetical protein
MALTTCPDCKGQLSTNATACPHCGAPTKTATPQSIPAGPKVATCQKCGTVMVATQQAPAVSVAGMLSVFGILIALLTMLFNVVAGLVILIAAILVGMMKGKKTVMKCPSCGATGATI